MAHTGDAVKTEKREENLRKKRKIFKKTWGKEGYKDMEMLQAAGIDLVEKKKELETM